jgi:hypothetical protein
MILLVRSLGELSIDSLIGLQNGFFFLWKTKGIEMKGVTKMGMQKTEATTLITKFSKNCKIRFNFVDANFSLDSRLNMICIEYFTRCI